MPGLALKVHKFTKIYSCGQHFAWIKATGIKCIINLPRGVESLSSSWQVFLHCSLKTHVVLPILLTGSENWCIPNMLSVPGIPFVFVGALPWVTHTKWKRKRSVLPTSGSGSTEDGLGKKRRGQTPKDDYGALEQGNIWMRSWRMSVDYKWERICLRTGMATVYCYPAEEQCFRTAVVEGNRSTIRNIGSWISEGLGLFPQLPTVTKYSKASWERIQMQTDFWEVRVQVQGMLQVCL